MRPNRSQQPCIRFRWLDVDAGCSRGPGARLSGLEFKIVNPLRAVVRLFVNGFGITHPTPEAEEKAGRAILAMLIAVVLVLGTIAWVLRTAIFHQP
jgi:hypothetical protein